MILLSGVYASFACEGKVEWFMVVIDNGEAVILAHDKRDRIWSHKLLQKRFFSTIGSTYVIFDHGSHLGVCSLGEEQ